MPNRFEAGLTVVGANHKSAPIGFRERLWCRPKELPARLKAIRHENPHVKETVILSTCNRTEIYAVHESDEPVQDFLLKTMSEWSGLQTTEIDRYLYSLTGEQAIQHLIEVAAGLDSLVIGEQQIHSQVRDALNLSNGAGSVNQFSSELFNYAWRAADRIRSQSGLGVDGWSVSSAAISLLKELSQKWPIKTILLVGAGKMIALAANDLSSFSADKIWVTNRTIQRAKTLADRLGGKPLAFDKIGSALEQADAVLSCTAASTYVITRGDVVAAMAKRPGSPLILIDAAVPRNIDPASDQIQNVQLFNVDNLAPFANRTPDFHRLKVAKAKELARSEAHSFYIQITANQTTDTMRDPRKDAEKIRGHESYETLPRELFSIDRGNEK